MSIERRILSYPDFVKFVDCVNNPRFKRCQIFQLYQYPDCVKNLEFIRYPHRVNTIIIHLHVVSINIYLFVSKILNLKPWHLCQGST